jgi:hypothetical protein
MTEHFENWFPFRELRIGDFPQCGECSVVYALRDGRSSEVLKFGETDLMRRRIFGNYVGGVGGSTTQFIHQQLFYQGIQNMIDYVEIAWIVAKDKATAKVMEGQFRQSYKMAHGGQRPPWDRRD